MHEIDWIAVIIAAVSAFILGAIWYAPQVFGRAWMKASGVTESRYHTGVVFGVAFVLSLVAAAAFAAWVGPDPGLQQALCWGLVAGLLFVGTSFGINYLFEGKPLTLWLINAGYHTAQFVLYGLVLGLM